MTFEARFHGQCPLCEERIKPGQRVKYVDNVLVHDDCEESAPPPESFGEVCMLCFMEKSTSGACGC